MADPQNTPPSQRCFGPYHPVPVGTTKWPVPPYIGLCSNQSHGRHFVDTRTGVLLTCGGPYVKGLAPGPANIQRCQPHGHIVDIHTQQVVG